MDLQTNIIRNVYNIGTSSCDAGTQYCSEGYSLYFPCLKDITRGQDVCFDFYVADNSTKDVVDLNTVDDITLNLFGQFGCSYGSFSYPDNISSLQKEDYNLIYSDDMGKRKLCQLLLIALDTENTNYSLYLNTKNRDFYSDTTVKVSAYDTKTHIFIGWSLLIEDDECSNESVEDLIISKDNIYTFTIKDNTKLFALYRPRKKYDILVDSRNKYSHYNVTYKGITHHISNKPDEIFDDSYDKISNVLEGYSVKIECIPNIYSMGSDSDDDYSYMFVEWKDGNDDRIRVFHPGIDTKSFEKNNEIHLLSMCSGPVTVYELDHDYEPIIDYFDEDGIHIYTEESETNEYDFIGDEYIKYSENTTIKSIGEEKYLHINNGKIILNSVDNKDGIKVSIHSICDDECELFVTINGSTMSHIISKTDDINTYKDYIFYDCGNYDIEISTYGDCLIDEINVYSLNITDKGKARLCLDADTVIRESEDSDEDDIVFSDIPTGPLSVSGAIMVNGVSYGLSTVQIGKVNKLNKITLY